MMPWDASLVGARCARPPGDKARMIQARHHGRAQRAPTAEGSETEGNATRDDPPRLRVKGTTEMWRIQANPA